MNRWKAAWKELRRDRRRPRTFPLPKASMYGRSVHDGSGDIPTDARALRLWDDAVKVDPLAPVDERPMWFRKIGHLSPLTNEVADMIRGREEAGYLVSFTVDAPLDKVEADLKVLWDRAALPSVFGVGNEYDFGGRVSAVDLAQQLKALPEFLLGVQEETGMVIANPGMSSIKHALGDYGRMYGDLYHKIPKRMAKLHSYEHVNPDNWKRFGVKKAVLKNMNLPEGSIVAMEETANGFLKHAANATDEKILSITGAQGADFAYSAFLAGCQEEMFIGHFLLDRHGINAISHPEHGAQRIEAIKKAMAFMESTGTVGTLEDLILPNPAGKEVDAEKHFILMES